MGAEDARAREARDMLAYFTQAKDGEAVMDGDGVIWHRSGAYWYSGTRRRMRQVTSIDLARGLCPDLADLMVEKAGA